MQCYTCFGKGRVNVTCPTCGGKGCYFKPVGGRNVFFPCSQCGGHRQVEVVCQTCHGMCVLPDPQPVTRSTSVNPPSPPPLPPNPELLKLAGRWKGGGARYELVRDNRGYHVTTFNLLGWKIGEGQATISGSTLTVTVRTLWCMSTADLQLKGDILQGVMRILGGLPLPFTLRRA
jgi:hypothetical protein